MLGSNLTLPERLEQERERIEEQLPEFDPEAIGPGGD